jgi:tetratricopeptide (TPR) repeat protein
MRALLEGRLDEAEVLLQRGLEIGSRSQGEMAVQFWATQLMTLRELQGRAHEMEPAIRAYAEQFPDTVPVRASLAHILAESGRLEESRVEYEIVAAKDFGNIPSDATWLLTLSMLSWTAAALGDVPGATSLYELLAPYANHTIVTGPAITCLGSASRWLGLLSAAMGDPVRAEKHYREAVELNQRMGARPYLAHTLKDYGELLVRGGDAEGASRGIELLERAAGIYRTVGMRHHLERAEALLGEAGAIEGS